mgnify:CR=1 FL=1
MRDVALLVPARARHVRAPLGALRVDVHEGSPRVFISHGTAGLRNNRSSAISEFVVSVDRRNRVDELVVAGAVLVRSDATQGFYLFRPDEPIAPGEALTLLGRFPALLLATALLVVIVEDVVVGNSQVALFAAFGSIALLVFVEFGGSIRARFAAYAGLALAGAGTITLGTLCGDSTALASVAMFVVGFGILFAGVLNGYVAAAQPAAILSFVLALMVPADASQIPDRLAGWGIAAALATAAVLLVWPQRPRSVHIE